MKVLKSKREEGKEKTLTVSRQNDLIVRKTRETSGTVLGFCKNGSWSHGVDVHGLSFDEERL